jgi:hypothetical protein
MRIPDKAVFDSNMDQKKCLIAWDKKDFDGEFFYNYGK